MRFLVNEFKEMPSVKQVTEAVGTGDVPAAVFGLPDIGKMPFAAAVSEETGKKSVILTGNEAEAIKLKDEFESLGKKGVLFPARDYNFLSTVGYSREYEHKRITALWQIINGDYDAVFIDIEALTQKSVSAEALKESAKILKVGDEINLESFLSHLVSNGYETTEQVDGVGQFSHRGGIVDIFPPGSEKPVRIELWGDEIDTIVYFDFENQRRLDSAESVTILPAAEFSVNNKVLLPVLEKLVLEKKVSNEFKENVKKDIELIGSGLGISTDKYMEYLEIPPVFPAEYFKGNILFISEIGNISSRQKNLDEARKGELSALLENGVCNSLSDGFWSFKGDFIRLIKEFDIVYLESFTKSSYPINPKSISNIFIRQINPWGGSLDVLIDDITPAIKKKSKVVILAGSEKAADILVSQLSENNISAQVCSLDDVKPKGGIYVTADSFPAGFEITERNILVIARKQTVQSAKKRKKRNKNEIFNSLDELKVGDFVVHYAHGIGQFDGIHRIQTDNIVKDYIKIKYRGTDVLYVPVTQLDLVSRYIGGGENGPALNRLGGTEWQKTRTRVKAAVKSMAKELTKLYSERLKIKGFAFSLDGELQKDFEAKFPFEETEDQLKAIDEIKGDMESESPMDRLLCGDVGFGKTEVALRAAFKCICDGKQCALLVPTTILAWQHFLTVTERFGNLPIRVEMLSRFKTKGEITKIIKALKNGEVDMVIGTHRLISNDVEFKDLGLVIIDEEQRFGVAQKEKLKTAFKNVDVLTLTATPIPRTLNMAMSGIRDMSAIEEAPQDRQPVQTYVMEQNNGVLIEAIKKELRRGGQVYYMHNRVDSINHCAARLKSALPEANIAVAHGKMSEEELSAIWKQLLEGEIDILVCTTIIETGVDVPNANTLIIEDADRMGLAQLHQIRGRVGRSNRRAYAYFCFKRGKALSEIATKRLEAIREYTAFGSGFKIAMRDLEIRGAGNILGGEQHGHMDSVGYDMYIKLLSEAIDEEKGIEPKSAYNECSVDLNVNANIPENYITSLSARLEMYRKIADIKTLNDKMDVIDEFCDRFGEPPEEVLGLIDIALIKGAAERNKITEISGSNGIVNFYPKEFSPELAKNFMPKLGNNVKLITSEPVHFSVKLGLGQSTAKYLREIADKL